MARVRRLASALLLIAAAVQIACAQYIAPPPPHLPSVDLIVARGQTIVTGSIQSIRGLDWQTREITVKVQSVLKGKAGDALTARVRENEAQLARWKMRSDTVLLAVPSDTLAVADILDLSGTDLAVLTSQLTLIKSESVLLDTVKALIAKGAATTTLPKSFAVPLDTKELSGSPVAALLTGRRGAFADMLVNGDLEAWAHKALRSNDLDRRTYATKALEWFQTDENANILKGLLKDNGYAVVVNAAYNRGRETREYRVRKAAVDVLTAWHVDFQKPFVSEQVPVFESLTDLVWNGAITEEEWRQMLTAKHLRTLQISYFNLTHMMLESLGKLTDLQILVLFQDGVRDEDVSCLLPLTKLQMLHLTRNPVSDKCLPILEKLPGLKDLLIDQTDVTNEGLIEFKLAKPGVSVFPDRTNKSRPAKLVEQSNAACDRTIYKLGGFNSSLAHWATTPLGRIHGELAWTKSPSGRPFIGQFGQQSVTLTLGRLPKHENVSIDLDLFVIGSWDGNGDLGPGPDVIDISIPGVGTLMHSTFFNNSDDNAENVLAQSYPDVYPGGRHKGYTGASEVRSLGFTMVWNGATMHRDAIYRLHFTVPHNRESVQLEIRGENVVDWSARKLTDDETWGIGAASIKVDVPKR